MKYFFQKIWGREHIYQVGLVRFKLISSIVPHVNLEANVSLPVLVIGILRVRSSALVSRYSSGVRAAALSRSRLELRDRIGILVADFGGKRPARPARPIGKIT